MNSRDISALIRHRNNSEQYKKLILSNELDVNHQISNGSTALFFADIEKTEWLLRNGADPNIKNNSGYTALFDFMLSKSNKYFNKDLKVMINLHVKYGLNIEEYNKYVETYVYSDSIYKSTYSEDSAIEGLDLISYLDIDNLKRIQAVSPQVLGKHIGKKEYIQHSPLFFADLESKSFLLKLGLDINAINEENKNALFYIKNIEELKLLINNNIKKEQIDENGFLFGNSLVNRDNISEYVLKDILSYFNNEFPEFNCVKFPLSQESYYNNENDKKLFYYLDSQNFQTIRNNENEKNVAINLTNFLSTSGCEYLLDNNFNLDFNIGEQSFLLSIQNKKNFMKLLPTLGKSGQLNLIEKDYSYTINQLTELLKKFNNQEFEKIKKYLIINKFENLTEADIRKLSIYSINGKSKMEYLKEILDIDVIKNLSAEDIIKDTNKSNIDYLYKNGFNYFEYEELLNDEVLGKTKLLIKEFMAKIERNSINDSLSLSEINNNVKKIRRI